MKNHYIPQFIINRFSTAVNVFNLDTTEIREKRPSNKIFFTKNIYTDDVEVSLNRNLETPFSSLLKSKLLKEGEIRIDRLELGLIKKYMFVTSVRSQDLDHFCTLMCGLEKNAKLFIETVDFEGFKRSPQKKSKDMLQEMSQYDFFNQQLKALSEFDINNAITPYVLFNDERLSLEMAALACSFFFSYVAFWDSPNESEFVLSDAGIISEYEGFHQLTGGLDASKTSYLLHQMNHSAREIGSGYIRPLQTCSMMYENYDLFNIASNRCIVAINPFFRLYDSKTRHVLVDKLGRRENYQFPVPDIWPGVIRNKNLFETPYTDYTIIGHYLPSDTFVYKPKVLDSKEMIYINSLLINQSKIWIGFNDPNKVFSSFEYCLEHESEYHSVTKRNEKRADVIVNYANNLMNSRFNKILEWCIEQGCQTDENILAIFEELLADIYRDFNSNFYIYEYYLKNYNETYNLEQLDFLGDGDKTKKMEFLVSRYNMLKSQRGEDK